MGAVATFSVIRFDFQHGFGAGLHGGGFFASSLTDWLELRVLIDDIGLVHFDYGRAVPRFSLTTGAGLVTWLGPIGFGVSGLGGVAISDSIGFAVAGLASVRVRFGGQPRHELALEGGMTFGMSFAGGDYMPGFLDGVARVTYTVSWGFVERVALPASTGAE